MIILGGCSAPRPPAPTETVRQLSWSRISLPDSVAASSLSTTTGELLVGGRATAGGDHPVLFVVNASGTASPVPLHPNSPYAKVADMVSVAARGNQVVALGAAHGGAHANFRWTVWTGSKQGLDDQPQTFETFGGESAGSLLDIVFTSQGPAIAGQLGRSGRRSGRRNLAAARGTLGPAELCRHRACEHASGPGRPRAAAAAGSAMIISGSVITFGDGVEQRASVWTWPTHDSP